jgi:hypothetical protein
MFQSGLGNQGLVVVAVHESPLAIGRPAQCGSPCGFYGDLLDALTYATREGAYFLTRP